MVGISPDATEAGPAGAVCSPVAFIADAPVSTAHVQVTPQGWEAPPGGQMEGIHLHLCTGHSTGSIRTHNICLTHEHTHINILHTHTHTLST